MRLRVGVSSLGGDRPGWLGLGAAGGGFRWFGSGGRSVKHRGIVEKDAYKLYEGCEGSDTPVGGESLHRRLGGLGNPVMYMVTADKVHWQPQWEKEHSVMPRDQFNVPAHIPPEVSTEIDHVYAVPPQFWPWLKKLATDTPNLEPHVKKIISGHFTHTDHQDMFYQFAKPLKIYRKLIPKPYRTLEETTLSPEVAWEGAWLSFRQRVLNDYNNQMMAREYLFGALIGLYFAWLWLDQHRQYRIDMKLFYLQAPEHKINWVKPRGDLV